MSRLLCINKSIHPTVVLYAFPAAGLSARAPNLAVCAWLYALLTVPTRVQPCAHVAWGPCCRCCGDAAARAMVTAWPVGVLKLIRGAGVLRRHSCLNKQRRSCTSEPKTPLLSAQLGSPKGPQNLLSTYPPLEMVSRTRGAEKRMARGAGLLLSALAATTTAVVYDQPINVTWTWVGVGGASNNNWASCAGYDSGYCPLKCAQVTVEAVAEGGWCTFGGQSSRAGEGKGLVDLWTTATAITTTS